MGSPIITISKVIACNTSIMVVDPRFIANKYLGHDDIDAGTSFLWETFAGDQIPFKGCSNHTLDKYDFVNPIEVGLKETNCP
jgi:hypothetical protein